MEVAVFGGTFDPPTLAHELVMQHCLADPDIDQLWLMPSAGRIDKTGMTAVNHRQAMLEVIQQEDFRGQPRLVVSDFEMNLPPPNRTSETVRALKRSFPEHKFWFVFGADTYLQMPNWVGGLALRDELSMMLVEREGYDLPAMSDRIKHIVDPYFATKAVSSTLVRQRIERGEPISDLVSLAVENYIACNGLYKAIQLSGHGAN